MRNATISIDKAGRLVLPKALRDRFRLRPGARLAVEVHEDHLRLVPLATEPALVKKDGWWVHRGAVDDPEALTQAVEQHREERIDDLSR